MRFYDDTKPLYLETDASGAGLGTTLLQTRDGTICLKDIALDNTILRPIVFAIKSLTNAEHRYSNIERAALGILYGLEEFHHYCFARKVSIKMDHKPLVAIFKKEIVNLPQQIQCILLRKHQYRVKILYKPGLEDFIAYWLSHEKHKENKDKAIYGMDIRVDTIQMSTNVPQCMSVQQIQQATVQDEHLQWLKGYIIASIPRHQSILII